MEVCIGSGGRYSKFSHPQIVHDGLGCPLCEEIEKEVELEEQVKTLEEEKSELQSQLTTLEANRNE